MLFIPCAEVQIERHEQTAWKKGLNIMGPVLEIILVLQIRERTLKCLTER